MSKEEKKVADIKRMVLVKWVDSCGHSGWHNYDEIGEDGMSLCRTVGWLAEETDKYINIVQSVDDVSNAINQVITIPRVAITSIEELEKKQTKGLDVRGDSLVESPVSAETSPCCLKEKARGRGTHYGAFSPPPQKIITGAR